MVGGVTVSYPNMIAMPALNVAPLIDPLTAVNFSQLNSHNNYHSHVKLRANRINNLLYSKLATEAVTIQQMQKLIGSK